MKIILVLITSTILFSCKQQSTQQLPPSQVIATVGDEVISTDLLNAYMHVNGIANPSEEMLNAGLNKLIEETAMANIAKSKKLPMTSEQMYNFHYLQLRALASNAQQDYLLNNGITEEEILQEYNNVTAQTKDKQYHVQHLLYTDEIEAINVLEQIKSVQDYKIIQTQYKQENPDKVNVGDLGWLNLLQLPQSFREILPTMPADSLYPQVVNSQFGAHIVYLQAIKDTPAPEFADVKVGIENTLKAKKIAKFAQLALAKSRVKVAD